MVANLSAHKKEWEPFSDWAEKASGYKLISLVDADTRAFEVMAARSLPKTSESETFEQCNYKGDSPCH
jgi:formiminotetrahydrofolate cyclodeaminase